MNYAKWHKPLLGILVCLCALPAVAQSYLISSKNGLRMDANQYVLSDMATSGGALNLVNSFGFPIDANGYLLFDCAVGCGSGTVSANNLSAGAVATYAAAGGSTTVGASSDLTDTGSGLAVGSSPPTACGSATGCVASGENSVAGTPTAGQDYCRADSTTHGRVCSYNGGVEFSSTEAAANFIKTASGVANAQSPSQQNKVICTGWQSGPYGGTYTTISYNVNTADNTADVYDIGIVNAVTGALVCHTGAIAGTSSFAGAGGVNVAATSSCTITPNTKYFVALTSSAASPTAKMGGELQPTFQNTATACGTSSSGVIPNPINAIPADSWTQATVPTVVLHN